MQTPDTLQRIEPLALCRNWDDLRQALPARCEQLNVARTTVDRVGGLPDGQTSKLLAPVRQQEWAGSPCWRCWERSVSRSLL
jgi:hypothetical protein